MCNLADLAASFDYEMLAMKWYYFQYIYDIIYLAYLQIASLFSVNSQIIAPFQKCNMPRSVWKINIKLLISPMTIKGYSNDIACIVAGHKKSNCRTPFDYLELWVWLV